MNRYAIIVAGGTGSRMKNNQPKQFMLLNGLPILMHSIQQFYLCNAQIVVVLHTQLHTAWQNLCTQYQFTIPHQITNGGQLRAESVHNGLQKLANQNGIVAVHDAARPLAGTHLIELLYNQASIHGNAIPYLPITESLRQICGNNNKAVNRNDFVTVQTPQCFDLQTLLAAYNQATDYQFTDEASLFENTTNIHLVRGHESNIKITLPQDIDKAQTLSKHQNKN